MGFVTLGAYDAAQRVGVTRGLVVSAVDADSPAGRAGLKPWVLDEAGHLKAMGDILLGYQGLAIESAGQFMAMLEWEPPKDEIVFDVLRDGQIIKVVLNLKKAKAEEKPKPLPAIV
jgi:S1-C subfamily serine protease